ncbi:6110_t:CDS:2 [Scutellospora calospora]|uniref:6110_t:CDS:1 n=1 Tax=Scutellospora calospora TaxID=85575 RepID=A0ACA9LL66_9GLOM|nr:6110_t:CDS:2 [Scutellospora calospora]
MTGELGYSPFRLVYGRDAITPLELTIETYQTFVTKKFWTTEELLEFRTLQMKNLSYELKEVQVNRDELREQWKYFHDQHSNLKEKIDIDELVLLDGTELRDPITRNRVKKLKESSEKSHEFQEGKGADSDLEDEGHGESSSCHGKNKYAVYLVKGIDLDL